MHVYVTRRLQLHKTVILLLIIKYFVLRKFRILIQLHYGTLSRSSLPIAPHKENHSQNTLATLRLKLQKLKRSINVISL